MKKLMKETGVGIVGVENEHVVDKQGIEEQNPIVEGGLRNLLARGSTVVMFGLGFLRPVSSRNFFRLSNSSASFTKQNLADCIICNNLAEFPLNFDRQSAGFSSWGTHRARPFSDSKLSRITHTSRAARFSAPEYCSRFRLSLRLLASIIAAISTVESSSVRIEVT